MGDDGTGLPTLHLRDLSKPVMATAPQRYACACGSSHFDDWEGWGSPISQDANREGAAADAAGSAGDAASSGDGADGHDVGRPAAEAAPPRCEVIGIEGPILPGSVVVVRSDRVIEREDEFASWSQDLVDELERIAGHDRLLVFYAGRQRGSDLRVLTQAELAEVARRHEAEVAAAGA
jgi:hypothetical protein